MAAKKKASAARAAPQKSKKKKSRAGRIVAVILLTVLLAAVGCGIYYAIETNGFTRFEYVEYNGRRLGTAERGVKLARGKNVFEIKSMKPAGGAGKYTVKIQANGEAKFTFQADGNPQSFAHVGEVTEYFGIEISEDRFEVNIPSDYSVSAVLSEKYGGETVTLPDELPKDTDFWIMSVGLSDGKNILIYFGVSDKPTISINPPHIIF